MITTLLCDDEALALQRLGEMMARFDDVSLLPPAGSAREALDRIAECSPQLVFLDVEMPGLDGFDVVEELIRGGGQPPLIVFATAYPQFATSAFDTGAIDFLTKPVRMSRLELTMARVRAALADRSAQARLLELSHQLDALRSTGSATDEDPHIWIRRKGEAVRVSLDRVDIIRAEAEYVRIVCGPASYLHREPLAEFLKRLDPQRFLRVHRSLIVNRNLIAAVKRSATGSYRLEMADGTELAVGRSYREAVLRVVTDAGKPID